MCAPALLVGENHAHAFHNCFVGGAGGAHQARQVVGVGHSNATLAAGHSLYLVGITSLGCACHVVDQAFEPCLGFFSAKVFGHCAKQAQVIGVRAGADAKLSFVFGIC